MIHKSPVPADGAYCMKKISWFCVRIIYSRGERAECRQWQEEGGERVAAVDKIEEKRKPEDFIGHRNRTVIQQSIVLP